MSDIRRIGILTSGGDAPGMNAAIRAIVRTAISQNISCLGIYRGYNGLINNDVVEMDARSVDGIQVKGGTMLYTARCDEFRTPEGIQRGADTCRYLGIQGLVAIGGDGSFRGARDLARMGVATIGIPATIDNDIQCTHYTIGFDTASNTAVEAIDKATRHDAVARALLGRGGHGQQFGQSCHVRRHSRGGERHHYPGAPDEPRGNLRDDPHGPHSRPSSSHHRAGWLRASARRTSWRWPSASTPASRRARRRLGTSSAAACRRRATV